ncbi:MAG: endonuclease/exonuclease/phosphatase family protein [Sporichthyaceae bacterium]
MSETAPGVRDRLATTVAVAKRLLPVAVLGACVPSAIRLVGDRDVFWAIMLVCWVPVAALLLALLGVLALAARRRLWAGVAAAAVALNVLWLAPLYVADDPPRSGERIVAMTANLLYGWADVPAVVQEVRERRVDVLALTELTPEAVTGLEEAGLLAELPHKVLDPGERAHGSGLYARFPLTRAADWEGGVHRWPGATARLDGQEVTIRVVHPFRTSRFDSDLYRADYRLLKARMDRIGEDAPALVLGDFNATRDHSAFRRLLGDRWRDAPEYAGSGYTPTWNLWQWLPAAIQLDHILISRHFGARSAGTWNVPGSDHHAVVAELVLRPR